MRTIIYPTQTGFSILEVIGAIAIIVIGMVGLISLSTQSLAVINNNQETLTAGELAREGIELVKNNRDSNWLAGNNWLSNLGVGDYAVSYDDVSPFIVSGGINDPATSLYVDANGFYSRHAATGAATIFKRMVTVSGSTNASTTLTSLVQYNIRGATKQYKIVTVLYDWN